MSDKANEAELIMLELDPVGPSLTPATLPEVPETAVRPEIPRRMSARRPDLEKFQYTTGCYGCKALQTGGAQTGHSEACRQRISDLLQAYLEGRKGCRMRGSVRTRFWPRMCKSQRD